MAMYTDNVVALNAVTTTTTSPAIDISMREQVSVQFICTGHVSGNGVFSIDVSNDNSNWITGIAFQDAKSTASTTWVTSKTLSANGTDGVFVPLMPWRYMRVVCAVTTDGAYTAIVEAQG